MKKHPLLSLLIVISLFSCKKDNNKPADGTPCDDGIPCTVDDKYTDGKCHGTSAVVFFDDNNPCTMQSCDSLTGSVSSSNYPLGTPCEDGQCDGFGHCELVIDPMRFLPTISFDAQGGSNLQGDEQSFPVRFDFNTTQDGNNDGETDREDNLENYVKQALGEGITGTGFTGLAGRGPNDQRPAVYFHYVETSVYRVYEYWYYFADHNFASINYGNHEHDWIKFFVYLPKQAGLSPMVTMYNNGTMLTHGMATLFMDGLNPWISVDAGVHNFSMEHKGGVKIRYNGEIYVIDGTLTSGDNQTIPWLILSNDNVYNTIHISAYTMQPAQFFQGDPTYPTSIPLYQQDEYGDPVSAPWLRPEWNSPPTP